MLKNAKTETEDRAPLVKNPRFVSSSGKEKEKARKEQRLAEALRANLRKRKDQMRGRKSSSLEKD